MGNSNNTIILNGCIQEFQNRNEIELDDDEIFEIFSTFQITKNYELSFEEIEQSVVDGGQDGGIDTFLTLVDDNMISAEDEVEEIKFLPSTVVCVFIGQAKTEKTFTEATIDKLIASIPLFFNLELSEQGLLVRFNSGLVEKLMIFRKIWENAIRKGSKINIQFYYACKANDIQTSLAFDSKMQQIVDMTKERVHGSEVGFTNFSAKELLDLNYRQIFSDLDLKFKETPMPISYDDDRIGYIGSVKLPDYLAFIVDENNSLRENIFESNVRHYQGDVDVNKEIQNSIESDYDRDFWWLNNGITIISSKVRQIGKTLVLTDVQIVNGLQTSFTIANYYELRENDDRSVLIKVIESRDKETIDKIISSTNRQNPVSATLLRATEDTQRTIELYFLSKGYFYIFMIDGKISTRIKANQLQEFSVSNSQHKQLKR